MRILKLIIMFFCVNFGFLYAMEDDDLGLRRLFEEGVDGSSVVGPINISGAVDEPDVPWEAFFCKICLDSNNKVVVLPCHDEHIFCKKCLHSLVQKRCPLCRAPLVMERILSLPEYEPRALWGMRMVEDSVFEQALEEIISSLAENVLREQKKLQEQKMLACEDRNSFEFRSKMERKIALQHEIQEVTSKIKRDRIVLRCSKCCLHLSCWIGVASLISMLIFAGYLKSCENVYCSNNKKSDCLREYCSGEGNRLVGSLCILMFCMGSLGIGLFCIPSEKLLTDLQHELQRLQDEFAREFGDEDEANDNGAAVSSSQPRGGEAV